MKFEDLKNLNNIFLYLGDWHPVGRSESIKRTGKNFIGLSLTRSDRYHIKQDITKPVPLKDNTVDIILSEDVMEHIEYSKLKDSINEIYRILKPGGLFRLSMPDYTCDVLINRSLLNEKGEVYHDPTCGKWDNINKCVVPGGHVWFPNYKKVKKLLESTRFENGKIKYLHYYDNDNNNKPVTHKIDYSKGHIHRTPDTDQRVQNPYRPMSIVVDCYK
tara:strand:- start:252 stop:902 length:651 start_codon:yes stop_codon:yes gene_type:complete